MSLKTKQLVIAALGGLFLLSLVFVQWMEVARKREEAGLTEPHIAVPASSRACVDCHVQTTPGIIAHWKGSTHAEKGVGCVECHQADHADADAFMHYGAEIAAVVTPLDCSRCHVEVFREFERSHHAAAGNILASLDNFLAETVEGSRERFDPHSPTPGMAVQSVNGMASAQSGCQQCHGSKVALRSSDGGMITLDDLKPGPDGKPTNLDAVARIVKDQNGKPELHPATWPNTGIGRLNLDGSLGSCSACHSRHDFSPRRARQPENCGKCHLGPDHPQKEIYEESKHGVVYRDMKDEMNLDADKWVLGEDYSAAPTCATCHMSGNIRNGGRVTHDPGERISWTNRPPISMLLDTDINHKVVTETDPAKRQAQIADTWQAKRGRMKEVCSSCHTPDYVNNFYTQYDDLVILYNEKFAKPGKAIIDALRKEGLITKSDFDEEIEWTWFYLWHHEGRRARHGAAMMAPDYTHWHGMYEVADRFYTQLLPQAREICESAMHEGKVAAGSAVLDVIEKILARPEHRWKGTAEAPVAATSQQASGGAALRPDERPPAPAAPPKKD
ncbi:MAG: multiheme c-type cytochrome [Planctomycetota bacterium]